MFSTSSRRAFESAGFTLFELIAVMVIVGIAVGIAIPTLGGAVEEAKFELAVSEVEQAIQYARQMAIQTGRECRVTIDVDGDSLAVEWIGYDLKVADTSEKALARGKLTTGIYEFLPHPLRPDRKYRFHLSKERRTRGVDVTASVFEGRNYVVFDRFGRPSSPGAVTITFKNWQVAVVVSAQTGNTTRITVG